MAEYSKRMGFIVSLLLLIAIPVQGQDTLSVSDAVQIALENNFSIRIAKNNAEIANNNNTIGNAGFLPNVNANGSFTRRVQNNVTNQVKSKRY